MVFLGVPQRLFLKCAPNKNLYGYPKKGYSALLTVGGCIICNKEIGFIKWIVGVYWFWKLPILTPKFGIFAPVWPNEEIDT